jgi:UDP-N-acetylmuramoyl-tripeptide--D-alanyl-D-alanine ligase
MRNDAATSLTLEMVLEATSGQLLGGAAGQWFTGVSTDSRTLRPGELFVALKGERFDGHRFVHQAVEGGAAGLVVALEESAAQGPYPVAVVGVRDTLHALGDLAGYWRRRLPIPVVAVTGSNGKTTTKEMVACILSRSWRVLKNRGNLNNLVGLPLTLLELETTHQAAVVEMGMNRAGEIGRLARIARPDVGLVTNIQPAHLEGLGSLRGIQSAKGELFAGMPVNATIVVNLDDPRVVELASSFPGRRVGYSTGGVPGEVTLERIISMDAAGTHFLLRLGRETRDIRLPVVGRHHLSNAVAAAAVAWALGLPTNRTAEALATFRPFDRRTEILALPHHIHVINDTYNANPGSMAAALETLTLVSGQGKSFAVLGDMLEMGAESAALHRELGRVAAGHRVDHLVAMGAQATNLLAGAAEAGMPEHRLLSAGDHREAAVQVQGLLASGDWVLVKGSRAMRMERVVEALVELLGNPGRTLEDEPRAGTAG